MSISVCMACYNGEKFIYEQIKSILVELSEIDELIIIDDCSKDSTIKIIESFKDNRIKLYQNSLNLGVVKTFEKAIDLSKNENIFLTDQDDIWITDRVSLMINSLNQKNAFLVSSNFAIIDRNGQLIENNFTPIKEEDSCTYLKNILNIFLGRINYYGCAMAFKRDFIKYITPFPKFVENHDLWIAMLANIVNKNVHIKDETLKHRLHGNNASVVQRNIFFKINTRIKYLYLLIVAYIRILKKGV